MKKTQEIIGLPIISISDGMEVGKVKSIIINADKGAIDYIVVDTGIQILSARVIPTENVLGIGEYALTIENDEAINDISKIPAAIDLLQKNIQVRGTKVLTKKGRLIGEIGDIFIDEDDCCKIIGLEYIADITQKRVRIIPRDSVITFGKNLVVVRDDVENFLVDHPSQLGVPGKFSENEKKNYELLKPEVDEYFEKSETETSVEQLVEPTFQEDLSGVQEQDTDLAVEINKELSSEEEVFQKDESSEKAVQESSAASLFEQKQREYLKGRRATKTITDNFGNVIINEGDVITDEIIDEAKAKGKLIELVMNNKV